MPGASDVAAVVESQHGFVSVPVEPAACHYTVTLLGGFTVCRDGAPVVPAAGKPAQTVKLLAALGALHVEELAELLWPDVPASAGRARLRNVLARIRIACGELVVRDGEVVTLAVGTDVDVPAFQAEARRATLYAGTPTGLAHARDAAARYTGDFLPEDRFAPWALPLRERLRRLQVEALDLLIDDAVDRGAEGQAVALLEQAIDLEPLDECRYLIAARLLMSAGKSARALMMLRRAERVSRELGLDPSPGCTALLAKLGR